MRFTLRPVSSWVNCVTDVLFAILLLSELVKCCKADETFSCTGGSLYFVAHPADALLYQNPDIYHDFYVYKCVTTVVFTSGDRGLDSKLYLANFTTSLEQGLEAACAFMVGIEDEEAVWNEHRAVFGGKQVLMRSLEKAPNVQVIYLRLPGGKPDGKGFESSRGETLTRLYQRSSKTITTTDGEITYTIEELQAVVSSILKKQKAYDIRIMDNTTAMATNTQKDREHADHATSARIVLDAIKQDKIEGKVLSYGGTFTRRLGPTLNITTRDFKVKVNAFEKYAPFDKDMPKDYETALADVESSSEVSQDDDVRYVVSWMDRQYYVQGGS